MRFDQQMSRNITEKVLPIVYSCFINLKTFQLKIEEWQIENVCSYCIPN